MCIFPEDTAIPIETVHLLWVESGAWTEFESRLAVRRLWEHALIIDYDVKDATFRLHDVLRAFLAEEGQDHIVQWHAQLISGHRVLVNMNERNLSMWPELPSTRTYAWTWLPYHLYNAGFEEELRALLSNSAWLAKKLVALGPAALEVDLSLLNDPLTIELERRIRQSSNLLAPLDSPQSLVATLASRIPLESQAAEIGCNLVNSIDGPHFRALRTFPDLLPSTVQRVFSSSLDSINDLVVEPGGSWIATAGGGLGANDNFEISLWDPRSGSHLRTLKDHGESVNALLVSSDGSWLASAGGTRNVDCAVRVWNPRTGYLLHKLHEHGLPVAHLAVASDGSWLASASGDRESVSGDVDPVIRIWDPIGGTLLSALRGHSYPVAYLATSRDGYSLISADVHGTILIHDLHGIQDGIDPNADGPVKFDKHVYPFSALIEDPLGRWIATAASSTYLPGEGELSSELLLWDPVSGRQIEQIEGHSDVITALAIAPNGDWFASLSGGEIESSKLRVWDSENLSVKFEHTFDGVRKFTTLQSGLDGRWLAVASGRRGFDCDDIFMFDPMNGKLINTLSGHAGSVTMLVAGPGPGSLISVSGDNFLSQHRGSMILWNAQDNWPDAVNSGSASEEVSGPDGIKSINTLVLPESADWIATSAGSTSGFTHDCDIRIWSAQSGQLVHTLSEHTRPPTELVTPSDGAWLASSSSNSNSSVTYDTNICIWNPGNGSLMRTLSSDEAPSLLSACPRGEWLASVTGSRGGEHKVVVWNPRDGSKKFALSDHAELIRCIVSTPDGKRLATAGGGLSGTNEIRIWDMGSGSLVWRLPGVGQIATSMATSQDGLLLAAAGEANDQGRVDFAIRIWRIADGSHVRTFRSVKGPIDQISFVGGGRYMLSVSQPSRDSAKPVLSLWDVDSGLELRSLSVRSPRMSIMSSSLPENGFVTAGIDGVLQAWSPLDEQPMASLRVGGPINVIAQKPGSVVAGGDYGLYVMTLDLN